MNATESCHYGYTEPSASSPRLCVNGQKATLPPTDNDRVINTLI